MKFLAVALEQTALSNGTTRQIQSTTFDKESRNCAQLPPEPPPVHIPKPSLPRTESLEKNPGSNFSLPPSYLITRNAKELKNVLSGKIQYTTTEPTGPAQDNSSRATADHNLLLIDHAPRIARDDGLTRAFEITPVKGDPRQDQVCTLDATSDGNLKQATL